MMRQCKQGKAMFKFSFRMKVFLAYLGVVIFFLGFIFTFSDRSIRNLIQESMEDETLVLYERLKTYDSIDAVVAYLTAERTHLLFKVSLWDKDENLIFGPYEESLRELGVGFDFSDGPDLVEAREKGIGYVETYVDILDEAFYSHSKKVELDGEQYYLRSTFSRKHGQYIKRRFQMMVITLAGVTLLLSSFVSWWLIQLLTRPVYEMVRQVRPYQSNPTKEQLPHINLKQAHGEFALLASTFNDLVSQVRLQMRGLREKEEEMTSILESLMEGVVAVDKNLHLTFINGVASDFLNLDAKTSIGKTFKSLGYPSLGELARLCHTEDAMQSDELILEGRSNFRLALQVVAVPIEGQNEVALVFQDKSIQYEMLEMRKEFIANASHELKTPVTIIRGFAELLHEGSDVTEKQKELATEKIYTNCLRMEKVVKNLLALANVEKLSQNRLAEVDLGKLIGKCIDELKTNFPNTEVKFQKEGKGLFTITADPDLLELAFNNLLENGVRYSEGVAKIEVKLYWDKDGRVKIEFSDKGIGIPHEEHEKIFRRFYTFHPSRSKKKGGSGLGLAIVATIISRHGGQVEVSSEVDKGALFRVTLPKKQD